MNEKTMKPYVIGLDLGSTNSVFGIVDVRGDINFVVNLLGVIAAYCYFPKKPSIRVQTVDMSNDRLLTLF